MKDTGFEWEDIVEDAVARAGGTSATGEDVLKLTRGLRIIEERWQAAGFPTWRLKTHRVTLTGLSPEVQLPKNIDDIVAVNSIRSSLHSEMKMRRISEGQYHALTTKDTTGQPSQWALRRGVRPSLLIFPIGSTVGEGDALNILYVERPERFEAFEATSNIPGRWLEALVISLAHDLARKRPLTGGGYDEKTIQRLTMEMAEAEQRAQNADRERVDWRVRI